MKNRKYVLLFVIVLIAGFLRLYNISSNPPSLTWDEVAWGYNAYSLGIDGKDEFGRFLPMDYLESFGDFKPPVYAYLSVIPVRFFGLNEFAVRFPSAFFGILTVIITYFLVIELFHKSTKEMSGSIHIEMIALITSFLVAISPWHINLSRAAFEANVASFFIISGVLFFLIALRKNKWLLILSAIAFVLSMHTFNTARIVSPILVFILALSNYKYLLKMKKIVFISALIGLSVLAPALPFLFSPQARLRYNEVNIFTDINVVERANKQIANDKNAWWSKIIHNRRLVFATDYLSHYLDHFSPNFLFIKGDGNPKFSTQDIGQLYLWEVPFIIVGILLLLKKKEGLWWLIPIWLLVAILPAATARETPHALRIETALPTFQIITAYGIYYLLNNSLLYNLYFKLPFLPHKLLRLSGLLTCALFLVILVNLTYYLHGYYTFYAREFSGEWQYGYKEAINFTKNNYKNYDKIYITESLGRPYIYTLFFLKYSSLKFRATAVMEREAAGFVHVRKFDKFYFYKFKPTLSYSMNEKNLYIDTPVEVPENAKIIKTFNLLNNLPSLVAYEI